MAIIVMGTVFVDIKGFPYDTYLPTGRNSGWVETVHGGVGRNVAEDIANIGLHSVLLSLVDDTAAGKEVLGRLQDHQVDTRYMLTRPDGMGIWLAVFDNTGDLAGSISKRPVTMPIADLMDEKGDEIFKDADSIVIEIDMEEEIIERVFQYAARYHIPVYALVSNMVIASQRRDFLQRTDCFVCNLQEAELLFVDDLSHFAPEELADDLYRRITHASIPSMIITLGSEGAVYASLDGERGYYPPETVNVRDTSGAGDAFCAGAAAGLTCGKSMREAVEIGTRLAASVITISESTCPRFKPQELGLVVL
ncbi:MAG: carbohydrate kinase family protein [Blautia sp.]|nr:carbohydrate kinase family protein [Blautia sp.]